VSKVKLNKDGFILSEDEDVVVNRTLPELDECRNILLQVIKQAMDDIQAFKDKTKPEQVEIYQTAHDFLFDDEHYVQWGDLQLNLEQICEIINLDLDWIRQKLSQQIEIEMKKDGVVTPKRRKPYARKST
jgi:hypothetical protein